MRQRILILLFFWLTETNTLPAQSYSSVHYDTKDGLASATVYDISQDGSGFIWFATENGLCRFDGKNFRIFDTRDGLPDNSILKVHAVHSGRVYFTPFTHGLYYYENDSFFKVAIPDKYKSDLSTISVLVDKRNTLTLSGLTNSYIFENNQLISLHDKNNRIPETVFIKSVYDTLIIAGSEDSLYFIPDSGRIRSYSYGGQDRRKLIFDRRFQRQHLRFRGDRDLGLLGPLTGDSLFAHSENFLYIFNASTGEPVDSISVEKFSGAFLDNETSLWICTLGNGVYRLPSFAFRSLEFDGKSEIFSLIKTGRRIIAGTDFSKMYEIPIDKVHDWSINDISKYTAASLNPVAKTTGRNRIYSVKADQSDLYIGTDAFLLRKTGSSKPDFRKIHPIKDIDVGDTSILVCTGQAALLMDKKNLSITDTLLHQRSTAGVAYHGEYFIGTLGGLIKVNASTKKITELYNLFPPFKTRISALKRGTDDDLWIATSGLGLVHFKNDKVVRVLKEKDGLTSDICTALFVDGTLLWAGTNKGLNRIELRGEKLNITRFTSANGLDADFINTVLATDSSVYVGTATGLTIFNKSVLSEKSVCILNILQVGQNNRKLKKDSSYIFPYNALNIQIDFTAISFKSAGDITYSYQMEGLDQMPNTTRANFINFPTLQPGGYTLLIKAINKFGVESDTKRIRIVILPPWWATLLFRVTLLVAIGLIVLIIYRYNIRSIKRKQELKRDFEMRFAALEQKALQTQMNPHFIFNSLNSIQTFILDRNVEGANEYLTNFASLIRQTLENSMNSFITVASEIQYIETYLRLEKLRFRDKFEYRIQVDDAIEQNNTLLPGMLLQPYIENSIRHGIQHRKDNEGLILVTMAKTTDNAVLYTIKDNGVGRKKAEQLKSSQHIEYQSRGTSINEKRIAAINIQFRTAIRVATNDVLDDKDNVTGTSVTIIIPAFHNNKL
jgi:ligand-binding sensor domain-containing protein